MTLLPYSPQRCFYGSEHGKGEADGETGVLSQALRRAVYQGQNFSSARDMVEYMSKHYGNSARHYIHVESILRIDEADEVLAIPGTRKCHQFATLRPYILRARRLACFCTACRENRPQQCLNLEVAGTYTVHKCKHSAEIVLNEGFTEPEAMPSPEEIPEKQSPKVGDYVKLTCHINKVQKTYYAVVICVSDEKAFSVRFLQKSGRHYSFGDRDDEGLITDGPPEHYEWRILTPEEWTMDHRCHYSFFI